MEPLCIHRREDTTADTSVLRRVISRERSALAQQAIGAKALPMAHPVLCRKGEQRWDTTSHSSEDRVSRGKVERRLSLSPGQ